MFLTASWNCNSVTNAFHQKLVVRYSSELSRRNPRKGACGDFWGTTELSRRLPQVDRPTTRFPTSKQTRRRNRSELVRSSARGGSGSNDPEEKDATPEPGSFFEEDSTAIEYFSPSEKRDTEVPVSGKLAELPLFPLPLVLSPGQPIPLHIFEMRYRQMFQRIREGDGRFGIVMYDKDRNAHAAVGTMAEINVYEPLADGRIMTSSIGRERFRVLKYTKDSPYLVALVEYFDDEVCIESVEQILAALKEPLPQSGDQETSRISKQSLTLLERRVWSALGDVLRLSNKLYNRVVSLSKLVVDNSPETVLSIPEGHLDPEQNFHRQKLFSFAVSSILDMPVRQQQLLLQTRSTAKRLLKQAQLLEGARQYLAAQVTIKKALGES